MLLYLPTPCHCIPTPTASKKIYSVSSVPSHPSHPELLIVLGRFTTAQLRRWRQMTSFFFSLQASCCFSVCFLWSKHWCITATKKWEMSFCIFYKNKQTKITIIILSGGFFSTFRECFYWPHRVATPFQVFPVKQCLFPVSREVELVSVWTCHDMHILNITQQRRTLQVFSLRNRWIFNCDITWSNIMSFILQKMFFTE